MVMRGDTPFVAEQSGRDEDCVALGPTAAESAVLQHKNMRELRRYTVRVTGARRRSSYTQGRLWHARPALARKAGFGTQGKGPV
jgi:hypothetical protein